MEQPPGFIVDKNKAYKLEKSIYGLKQKLRQWKLRFHEAIKAYGFNEVVKAYGFIQSPEDNVYM